ncbi:M23 family metallopeptidase [Bacteroides pyogenes]|uniref:M23 family metallopeptidase n=1 Tax=Bacteroides pyogenes TaxID=310300 RepID=UPI003FA05E65
MKLYIAALMLAFCIGGYAQKKQASFVPPFDFPLTLSGNFGEIRSNHFHGGLDFKTGGVVGKPVRALADGYISRICVTNGSGYVLDVRYHNGYTTINRHLNGFLSPIAQRVEKLQYEKESWEVEIIPAPDEYPVKAGQQIAWSGNTGYSFGPHLHLDVFETETGDYVDPMPFFRTKIKDTRPPKADGIMLFPKPGMGVVEGLQENKVILPDGKDTRPIEAWGMIGAGIKAYDYMDGANNHYGVYSVVLTVDGKEMFRSTVDRFAYEENPQINSWTYGGYMKSFIDPGNTLRMLNAPQGNRGWVTIDEEREYKFVYTLSDVFGNTSRYLFTVIGKEQPIEPLQYREKYFFDWNKTNFLQEPGMTLVVPKGALYDDVLLSYRMKADSGAVAFTYQLHEEPLSLHTSAELRIGLRRKPVADTTKYYVARITPKGKTHSVGGIYEDGFMKTSVRELGTYTVAMDTVPPEITPVGKNLWVKNEKIVYRIEDKETGIRSFRGTIDGKYALFGRPNMVKPYWECKLNPKYMKKGGKHVVEITVTDGCGNRSVARDSFVW